MKTVNPDDLKVGDVIIFKTREGVFFDELHLFRKNEKYRVYKIENVTERNISWGKAKQNPLLETMDGKIKKGSAWWGTFIYPENINKMKNKMFLAIEKLVENNQKEEAYALTKIHYSYYIKEDGIESLKLSREFEKIYGYDPLIVFKEVKENG